MICTEEDPAANDLFAICLSELERYLHKVHVAFCAYLDPESTDNIIIKCERLLIVVQLLMVEDVFSDEILNGLDMLHGHIEEIITGLYLEIDFASVQLTPQLWSTVGHPKLSNTRVFNSLHRLFMVLYEKVSIKIFVSIFFLYVYFVNCTIQHFMLRIIMQHEIIDGLSLTVVFLCANFTHNDIAASFKCCTKTVSRRI